MENISVVDQEIDQRGIDSSKKGDMVKIGLNGLLFATFFLPWVKASSELGFALGLFDLSSMEEYMSISPYRLIEAIRTLSKFMDGDIGELAVLYAYFLIPIMALAAGGAILFAKNKSKSINIASSILVLVIALYTYTKVQSIDDIQYFIGFTYGYYAVILASLANIGLELFHSDKSQTSKEHIKQETAGETVVDGTKVIATEQKIISESTKNLVKGKEELVDFIKKDFSNKDKTHKMLLGYGVIIIVATIFGITKDLDNSDPILPGILAALLSASVFLVAYFKISFKIDEVQNESVIKLSNGIYDLTNLLSKIDSNLLMAIMMTIGAKFVVSYVIKSYEMAVFTSVVNLILNGVLVIFLIRALGLKDFKTLLYASISLGVMYTVMIFRKSGYDYYWVDYKALFMLGLSWMMYIFIKSNYEAS